MTEYPRSLVCSSCKLRFCFDGQDSGASWMKQDSISWDAVRVAQQAVTALPDDLVLASFHHQLMLHVTLLL